MTDVSTALKRPASVDNVSKEKKKSTFVEKLEFEATQTQTIDVGTIADQAWDRPPLSSGWDRKPIIFQQIDAQAASYDSNIVRMFGVTEEGHSVMCDVVNFQHYFYVPAPANFSEEDIRPMIDSIPDENERKDFISRIAAIEILPKRSIWQYNGGNKSAFLKIVGRTPKDISYLRTQIENEQNAMHTQYGLSTMTYDNISYELRCTIDCGIVGMSWITLPANKYEVVEDVDKQSTCQMEVRIDYRELIAHKVEGEWIKSAPLRIMSFDIECSGRKGIFPEPQIDPVITIACVVQVQGSSRPFVRNVFTLNTCDAIVGSEVFEHETENELLMHWADFVRKVDPDVMIGYNTTNFDFPYLIDRAEALGENSFPYFSRLKNVRQVLKDAKFSSKAYGNSESRVVNIEGRLQIDLLQYIRREYKLRSYTLNNVSARFLGEQKEDVQHSMITELQAKGPETRRRLAVYCLKDAYLPLRLLDKLMAFVNMTEMARVTGVPMSFLLSRGQQIKVVSQLFRKCLEIDMVIPNLKQNGGSDEKYEGATVIEPIRGYYEDPIATLDFSSLYPSIMMAHNLCYTTLIIEGPTLSASGMTIDGYIKKRGLNLTPQDYVKTPNGDYFVKSDVQHGILPIILKELLSARKKAKDDLKKEKDPFKRAILDGRQLALKISANSVYGFTGATVGKLPCLAISSSVTGYGRDMIEATKNFVEKHYSKANGYEHDSVVIYGDTDSVMVKFGTKSLEESMRLGEEAADKVSDIFINPIKLEFEKVYYPYLLINKKRYAGLLWTNSNKYDKMDTKGIETVRRDNCQLVQYVVETVLQRILIDRDPEKATEFVKQTIVDLLQNRVDLSLLVISKQLSRTDYAGKQAHSELAARMQKRDPGSAPVLGDRVPYVIVNYSSDKNYDKSEDPTFVLENDLTIDTNYYLENQLKNPLQRIFEPILGAAKTNSLLSTAQIRTRTVTTGDKFSKFAVKTQQCKGCRRPLRKPFDTGAVCENCAAEAGRLYAAELTDLYDMETKFGELWSECQSCQNSVEHDVICAAQDCPIFFMRRKVQKDLDKKYNELKKFDLSW